MANDCKHIFDDPKNVKRLLVGFYFVCGLLLVLDLVIHRHVIHSWEGLFAFYPIYGFVGCVVLVFVARWMRTFLMRAEDYYEENNPHKDLEYDPKDIHKDIHKDNNKKEGADHVDD